MKTFRQFMEARHVQLAPKGGGAWVRKDRKDDKEGEVVDHPTEKTVGNEPFKDKSYFSKSKVKKKLERMSNSKTKLPPVLGTEHPADPSVQSVVDGNHRRQVAVNKKASSLPVEKVPHENIRLLHPTTVQLYDEPNHNHGVKLSTMRKKDGSYDMDKPRKKLGGLTIRHYFVNPDGSHKYGSEYEYGDKD